MDLSSNPPNESLHDRTAYITFDDGPNKFTEGILDLCNELNVKVTFFLLVPNMKENKDLVKRMVKEGHSIGLHGVSHDRSKIYKSEENFIEEMKKCNNTLEKIAGISSYLIRAPYGSLPNMNKQFRKAVRSEGFKLWDWNVDSTDSLKEDVSAEEVIEITRKKILKLQRKEINPVILFHDSLISEKVLHNIVNFLIENCYTLKPLDYDLKPVCLWDRV